MNASTLTIPPEALRNPQGRVYLDVRRQYIGNNTAVLRVYAKVEVKSSPVRSWSPRGYTQWVPIYAEEYQYKTTKELPPLMARLVDLVEVANGVRVKMRSQKQFKANNTGEPV